MRFTIYKRLRADVVMPEAAIGEFYGTRAALGRHVQALTSNDPDHCYRAE